MMQLPGGPAVRLGSWLSTVRNSKATLGWGRPAMGVMGMRWETFRSRGVPLKREDLAERLRHEDTARRSGTPVADVAGWLADEAFISDPRDGEDVVRLGEAVARWCQTGTLDLPLEGQHEELDRWLERVLAGNISLDPWIRAALGALGIRWRAGADRAQIAVLLDAERDAWLSADTAALERARQATDQALVPWPTETKSDIRLLDNLRAAVLYWRESGHLEVPIVRPIQLADGRDVQLGTWVSSIREPRYVPVSWARPALDAMGMRWQAHGGRLVPVWLAALLRQEDEARRSSETQAAADAGDMADEALASAPRDNDDVVRLGEAVARWRQTRTLGLPLEGQPEELDEWVERVLAGDASPEPSVRAALGVLGIRWRATADRESPPGRSARTEDSPVQMPGLDWPEEPGWDDLAGEGASGPAETGGQGLPGPGPQGQPGSPALSQVPGPPAPDDAQQAALAAVRLGVILISADGDCLMNALIVSAPEAFGGIREPGVLREHMAQFLEDQIARNGPAWQAMELNARWSLAHDEAARTLHLHRDWTLLELTEHYAGQPLTEDHLRALVEAMRRPGEWGHVSADLAPAVAAAAFGLDLIIVYPGGRTGHLGNGGHRVTLVQVPGHWHGTQLAPPSGAIIAGLLQAEQHARQTEDIWAVIRAQEATDQALGRAADEARYHGDTAPAGLASDVFVSRAPSEDIVRLGEAVARWRQSRIVGMALDGQPGELDGWLDRVLVGEINPEPWILAALRALMISDRETAAGPPAAGPVALAPGGGGLPGSGPQGQPGGPALSRLASPALSQDPGPSAADYAQQFALAARGLELVPISSDGDGLMDALLASAPTEAFSGPQESAGGRERLARLLDEQLDRNGPVWRALVAAAVFGLDLTIVHPGGNIQHVSNGRHPVTLVHRPGHWHGARSSGQGLDLASGSRPAPADGSLPPGGPPSGAMIAGLLQAERLAWLTWEDEPLARTRQATDQALAVRRADATERQWENLRAAIQFWRTTGHLEIPRRDPAGGWLNDLRAKGIAPHWARPALGVLGLRWESPAGGNRTVRDWELLPARLREEVNARRRGDTAAAISSKQEDVDAGLVGSHDDMVMLRVAIGRWRTFRTLDRPDGHPVGGELDRWLEDVRHGRLSLPPWQRAALGALGIRWLPGADRVQIAGALQAERTAWLTGDSRILTAARQATDQVLADEAIESKIDTDLLVHLRAAVKYWRKNGHLEVPQMHEEELQWEQVHLGRWLQTQRLKKSENRNIASWVRGALEVLGMRWGATSQSSRSVSVALTELATLVREEDNARRDGDNTAQDTASRQIDETLGARPDDPDMVMLRAAVGRWRTFRTLDLPPGDPSGGELDRWLEDRRLGRVNPPPWLRQVLGALGLRWPALTD